MKDKDNSQLRSRTKGSRSTARHRRLAALALTALAARPCMAAVYTVDQWFSSGADVVHLAGTVDVPLGSYTIHNGAPNPFRSVNLTLNVDGTPYNLSQADTSEIYGTGAFYVDATVSALSFAAAGNGHNAADLAFVGGGAQYALGSDATPLFEAAYGPFGGVAIANFPISFGTAAAPEPGTVFAGLGALGLAAWAPLRRRTQRRC